MPSHEAEPQILFFFLKPRFHQAVPFSSVQYAFFFSFFLRCHCQKLRMVPWKPYHACIVMLGYQPVLNPTLERGARPTAVNWLVDKMVTAMVRPSISSRHENFSQTEPVYSVWSTAICQKDILVPIQQLLRFDIIDYCDFLHLLKGKRELNQQSVQSVSL